MVIKEGQPMGVMTLQICDTREVYQLLLQRNFYWPLMNNGTCDYVKYCQAYQQHGNVKKINKLISYRYLRLFKVLQMDYIVRLPQSSIVKSAIVLMVEMLSNWVAKKVVQSSTILEALQIIMDEVIWGFGPSLVVLTNYGTHFKGDFTRGLKQTCRPHTFTSEYHP